MATNEPNGAEKPAAEKGGCLNLGWGCLPAIAAILVLPTILLF